VTAISGLGVVTVTTYNSWRSANFDTVAPYVWNNVPISWNSTTPTPTRTS